MWSGWGLVSIVLHAEPANSADSGKALLKADKTAIHRASHVAATVLRAPRIILGFCGSDQPDGCCENSQYREQ